MVLSAMKKNKGERTRVTAVGAVLLIADTLQKQKSRNNLKVLQLERLINYVIFMN